MPLYEYTCEACGAHVEKLQNRGAGPPETCPTCSKNGTLRRGISKTSFHLKGGGWYVTDYSDAKGPGSATPPEDAAASSSGESSAPSAPATSGADTGADSGSDAGGSAVADAGATPLEAAARTLAAPPMDPAATARRERACRCARS